MSENKFKPGDIVSFISATGNEKGFFEVIRVEPEAYLYSVGCWNATNNKIKREDCGCYICKTKVVNVICKLVANDDGTIPKSKNLKERNYWDSKLRLESLETFRDMRQRAKEIYEKELERFIELERILFGAKEEKKEEANFLDFISSASSTLLRGE